MLKPGEHPESANGAPACLSPDTIDEAAGGRGLSPAEREHLECCGACRARLEEARSLVTVLGRLRDAIKPAIAPDSPLFDSAPLPQDLIPGYRLLGEISRGSQGVVYKAIQERTRRTVAVKMLLGGLFATERQRARFEREIEIVASLNHPGIVAIFDSTPVKGGRYAYATEFIEGGSPIDVWSRNLTGDAKQVIRPKLNLFAELCDIVHYAHQRGVIHRDLKPGNILIDAQSRPHVLDFGIAKVIGTPTVGQTLTGEIVGSPAYSSPEQLSGHPDAVDVRSDVYSLGVILYEMLCGRRPHDTRDQPLAQAVRDITERDATRLGAIDRCFRGDVETIAAKALERDKARRYQTANALASDIRHALRRGPIEAKRDHFSYVLGKSLRRHWRGCLAALIVLVVSLTVFVVVRAARDESSAAREGLHRARVQADEHFVRAGAISELLQATLPPLRVEWTDPAARHSSDGLTKLRGRIDLGYLADSPLAEWATQSALAESFRTRGALQYSEMALRQAVHLAVGLRGREDPAVAATLGELAEVLLERKRLHEAEWYCVEAIRIHTASLGPDDQLLFRDRDRLSRIQLALGDFEAAASRAAQDCGSLEKSPLQDKSYLAASLATWTQALSALGKHDDALDRALRVVKIRLETCSSSDRHLCDSLDRLADCAERVQSIESLQVLCEALSMRDTAAITGRLRKLASTLRARFVDTVFISENTGGSVEALNDLISLSEHIIGADALATGRYCAELGVRLQEARRSAEAEPRYLRALAILEKHHPRSLALANLHECLYGVFATKGDLANAIEHISRAIDIWRQQPASDLERASEWAAGREAAKCLILAGRYSEAATLASNVLEAMPGQLGADHYLVGVYTTIRGLALARGGMPKEGQRVAREGYRIISDSAAVPSDQSAWAGAFLAAAQVPDGNLSEARALLESCWSEFQFSTPSPDPLRRFVALELKSVCDAVGDHESAAFWHAESGRTK